MGATGIEANGERLRSPRYLALLWGALVVALVLGAGFLVLVHRGSTDQRADAMSDEQAVAQVVDSARQIVSAAGLQDATGGYTFMSCESESQPPYQAAFYLTFHLPHSDWARRLRDIESAMTAHGWSESEAMGEHFGQKLTKDGVTSVFYPNTDGKDFASMRLYGQCRNMSDHRADNPAWIDVTL